MEQRLKSGCEDLLQKIAFSVFVLVAGGSTFEGMSKVLASVGRHPASQPLVGRGTL